MATQMINSLNFGGNIHPFTIPYGTCATSATTAAKTVTVDNFSLETGAVVAVKFNYKNSVASPTLNVNSTGAKPIYLYGTSAANTTVTVNGWEAGAVQIFVYDGTGWVRDYWSNTTYSNATTSAAGLMSANDKTKLDNTNTAYGTCSTAAATAAKVVSVGNTNWALKAGSLITVYFSETNSAQNPTLNVNGTGAKNIYYGASQITTSSLGYAGTASRVMTFVYDGTQYRFMCWGYDSNTTYTNVKLGHGYVTCSTAAATVAKVGTLSSYTLTTGGIIAVKFDYDVPASATLNINSKGAKAIHYRGSAITAGIIKAGDIATLIYNGTNYILLAVDRWHNDIASLQITLEDIDTICGNTIMSVHEVTF